ncbi:UNKNOWN [Stylonychia lemnae]|uniref:Uncharacterized protein n=1 Tax=Stylonychia lemnae TaxID=5949 RepID=A0A078B7B5_STYLE|nr:UNKNOWN [Stylonychia lemnae]|eukprot:CDW90304.1 UNKNOWN [Stylonychia lemnae]
MFEVESSVDDHKELDKSIADQYPILADGQIDKINLSTLEKNIRSDKYKYYAHNLKYFKDYSQLNNNSSRADHGKQNKRDGRSQGDQSRAEMKNQFTKFQEIDNIRSKRNEDESLKQMFGADPLEVLYKQKNLHHGNNKGKSNFLNSKDPNRVSNIFYEKGYSLGKVGMYHKGLGLSHNLLHAVQKHRDEEDTIRSKSYKKMKGFEILTPIYQKPSHKGLGSARTMQYLEVGAQSTIQQPLDKIFLLDDIQITKKFMSIDRIDDFGLLIDKQKQQIEANTNLPVYSKNDLDALLLTENKPKFTLRDLSSKGVDIKDIFKQICPDMFQTSKNSPINSNDKKGMLLQKERSSKRGSQILVQNQNEQGAASFRQRLSPTQSPKLQLPSILKEKDVANEVAQSNPIMSATKQTFKSLDETLQDSLKSPKEGGGNGKSKRIKLTNKDIAIKFKNIKDIQSLTARQQQDGQPSNLIDILMKFKDLYEYNSDVAKFQVSTINTRRQAEGRAANPHYVNLFETNRRITKHIKEQQDSIIHQEYELNLNTKKKNPLIVKSHSTSMLIPKIRHQDTNDTNEFTIPSQDIIDQSAFRPDLPQVQSLLDTMRSEGFDQHSITQNQEKPKKLRHKRKSDDFTNLDQRDMNNLSSGDENIFAVDYEANKQVLPKIIDMHFIRHGDYLPLQELENKIKTFREYGEKSKSVYNMLKEKQRNDRKKFLEREEEKYREKIKGVKFDKEEKEWELERVKQIKESHKFKKNLQSHLEKGKMMSERQFKQKLNVLDVKFTKEFIKEDALENRLFEKEKLKIKQDIYLTRQHNKEMRKKVMFNRKNPDLNLFKD